VQGPHNARVAIRALRTQRTPIRTQGIALDWMTTARLAAGNPAILGS
jgi:hypothetical protein